MGIVQYFLYPFAVFISVCVINNCVRVYGLFDVKSFFSVRANRTYSFNIIYCDFCIVGSHLLLPLYDLCLP